MGANSLCKPENELNGRGSFVGICIHTCICLQLILSFLYFRVRNMQNITCWNTSGWNRNLGSDTRTSREMRYVYLMFLTIPEKS